VNPIDEYKLMFVHIPKTGGMNILTTLKNIDRVLSYDKGENIPNSFLVEKLRGQIGRGPNKSIWKSSKEHNHDVSTRKMVEEKQQEGWYFFSCVRNPFSRMVSAFYWDAHYARPTRKNRSWEEFVANESYNVQLYQPCAHWLADGEGIFVDKIVKLENLREDMLEVHKLKNIPLKPDYYKRKINSNPIFDKTLSGEVPNLGPNFNGKKNLWTPNPEDIKALSLDYKYFYDKWPSTIDSVLSFYKRDFELFEYSTDFRD
tara:strand:- start:1461 stop:2234 length:774 start_codon:yes stop_codon:yes gene_type:complete